MHRASTGRPSVGAWSTAFFACATILVFATGVSGCGDGVLQTTEVASSLRDAGYPDPRITPVDEQLGRSGGLANLLELFSGAPDVVTDVVEAGTASGDAVVSAIVYVRTSGAGAPVGEPQAEVTSFEGADLAQFQGEIGAELSVPRSFHLRRVRLAAICNVRLSVFEARDDDDRLDRAIRYLRARC